MQNLSYLNFAKCTYSKVSAVCISAGGAPVCTKLILLCGPEGANLDQNM